MYVRNRKKKVAKVVKTATAERDDSSSYCCTTITIAQHMRAFLKANAGKCFAGTCRIKGNSGFIGELLQREYDRQVECGEWDKGK